MEIYRELYQISKSLSEFTNKARRLHQLMSEPIKLEPNQVVKFDQPEWEQEFEQLSHGKCINFNEAKDFIRRILAEQRLQDSIEPEEI